MKLYLSLLHRIILRHWRAEALQTLIVLLIFALGIGAYFSIRLANRAAVGGFAQFHSTLQAQSDWVLRGVNRSLTSSDLQALRRALHPEVVTLIPVMETIAHDSTLTALSSGSQAYRMIGVDLLQLQQWNEGGVLIPKPDVGRESNPESVPPLTTLLERDAIWLSSQLASAKSLGSGDAIDLLVGDQMETFRVAGVLPNQVAGITVPDQLLLMDLPALQELMERSDQFDRVEVLFPESDQKPQRMQAALERLESMPLSIEKAGNQDTGAEMTQAFRLNLLVLSFIALLVALYLITQALDANVVRRRMEIATLKSLGFSYAMIRNLWLVELLVLGVLGSVLGLLFGWAMAQVTAGAVAQTVNALYFSVNPPTSVTPDWIDWGLALCIGIAGSLLAGLLPIRDAAMTPPAQILIARDFAAGFGVFRRPGLGLLLLAFGGFCLLLPPLPLSGGSQFPLGGYTAAFAWMLGGTLLTGTGFRLAVVLLRQFEHHWVSVRIARARLTEPSSRHRLAVAGLFIAVTMTASMAILVFSFSATMTGWIENRFTASVYGSSKGLQGAGSENRIRKSQWSQLEQLEGVHYFSPYASIAIELDGKRTFLAGARFSMLGSANQNLMWVVAPGAALENDDALINEAFAHRMGVEKGDRLTLPLGDQVHAVRVAGVFADYGNEQGTLLIDHAVFIQWTDVTEILNFSIDLEPTVDPLNWIEIQSSQFPGLHFRDNRNLKMTILRIFRQTFAVTEALQWIGLIVALAGLALAQWNLLRESRREWITLSSMGATGGVIGRATAVECAALGAIGFVGGIVLSFLLGTVLIYVINRQSFGWTLMYAIPWNQLGMLGLATILASAGIGYGVGRQSARVERMNLY